MLYNVLQDDIISNQRCIFACFWHILGHAVKNSGGQAQSSIRTIYLGQSFVDLAGACVAGGMPASAFARDDPQSDAIQALLSNPWFYVYDAQNQEDACNQPLELRSIPWHSKGALLWSLSTAMCFAPVFHVRMSFEKRVECAVSGFVLFDLWMLMSAKLEASRGSWVGSCMMARETVNNLQGVCLSVISMATNKPATRHCN